MKKKRFSVKQIVAALKQVELGMAVADLIRRLGISEQTYYRWKKNYAGLQSDQAVASRLRRALVGKKSGSGAKRELHSRRT